MFFVRCTFGSLWPSGCKHIKMSKLELESSNTFLTHNIVYVLRLHPDVNEDLLQFKVFSVMFATISFLILILDFDFFWLFFLYLFRIPVQTMCVSKSLVLNENIWVRVEKMYSVSLLSWLLKIAKRRLKIWLVMRDQPKIFGPLIYILSYWFYYNN